MKRMLGHAETVEKSLGGGSELAEARARITALEAELATSQAELATAQADRSTFEVNIGEASTTLATVRAEAETLKAELQAEKEKAAKILASQGINIGDLPASDPNSSPTGQTSGVDKQIADLRAQMNGATPADKFRLSNQIRDLLEKKK